MGLRIRRSNRLFQSIESHVRTSVGAPGTGIRFEQSSNGNRLYGLGTAILVAIAILVFFLP